MRKMGRTTKPRIKPQKRFGHGFVKNKALIKKDLGNFSSFWWILTDFGRFWAPEAEFWRFWPLATGFWPLRRIFDPKNPDSTLQNQ